MLLDGDGSWNLISPEGFVRKLSGKLAEIFQVAGGLFEMRKDKPNGHVCGCSNGLD